MLRNFLVAATAAATLWLASPVTAASLAGEIRSGQSVPVVPMAEWEIVQTGQGEQTGARVLIAAGNEELKRVPANASRYDSQTFTFPSGEIRVLKFRKATGGVLHQITSETQIYVAQGSASVDVAGVRTELATGDVVNLPSGVLRSLPNRAEDTTIIAYTIKSTGPNPKASVIRSKDNPPAVIESGEKAGESGAKVSVQRYVYDGNSIRIARLSGPGKNAPSTPRADALIYLISGRMNLHLGNEVFEVRAGDALREPAGIPVYWDILEPSSFIATNGVAP
jgi:quercetin dioxygenase-like cupin family protein